MTDLRKEVLRRRDYQAVLVTEASYPSGLVMTRHSHQLPGLVVVTAGGWSEVFDAGTEEIYATGALYYVPAQLPHIDYFHASSRDLTFEIKAPLLERFRSYKLLDSAVKKLEGSVFDNLRARLLSEYRRDDEVTPLAVECLVMEALLEAIRTRRPVRKHASPRLSRVRELLYDGSTAPLQLNQIAREVGMHPAHLSREFHRVFRCTMSEYVRGVRIDRAQTMLREGKVRLSDIALACGFYDQSHFSRSFKKSVGLTPLEYRNLSGA